LQRCHLWANLAADCLSALSPASRWYRRSGEISVTTSLAVLWVDSAIFWHGFGGVAVKDNETLHISQLDRLYQSYYNSQIGVWRMAIAPL